MRIEIYAERVGVRYSYDQLIAQVIDPVVVATLAPQDVAEARIGSSRTWIELRLHKPLDARPVETQLFAVLDGAQVISFGVSYNAIGAAAIQTPVMHLSVDRTLVVIAQRLGAFEGPLIEDPRWNQTLAIVEASLSPSVETGSPLLRLR